MLWINRHILALKRLSNIWRNALVFGLECRLSGKVLTAYPQDFQIAGIYSFNV